MAALTCMVACLHCVLPRCRYCTAWRRARVAVAGVADELNRAGVGTSVGASIDTPGVVDHWAALFAPALRNGAK